MKGLFSASVGDFYIKTAAERDKQLLATVMRVAAALGIGRHVVEIEHALYIKGNRPAGSPFDKRKVAPRVVDAWKCNYFRIFCHRQGL